MSTLRKTNKKTQNTLALNIISKTIDIRACTPHVWRKFTIFFFQD